VGSVNIALSCTTKVANCQCGQVPSDSLSFPSLRHALATLKYHCGL
jgi:hypothetical protein